MHLSTHNDIISLDLLGITVIEWSEWRDHVSSVGGRLTPPIRTNAAKTGASKMKNDLINIAKLTRDVVGANKWKIVEIHRSQNSRQRDLQQGYVENTTRREDRRPLNYIQILIIVQVCSVILEALERHQHMLKSP